jgi:GNAT superfamily N-acetyltransferase
MTPVAAGQITIRRVDGKSKEAAHDLYSMQEACLPDDAPADVSRGHWWIAEDDDEPVGFAGLYRSVNWDNGVYLVRSGVMPSHRGNGLQKRLIRVRLAFAKRSGFKLAVSETTFNPPSANSLIACGFKTFTPPNLWGPKGAIYFRKNI